MKIKTHTTKEEPYHFRHIYISFKRQKTKRTSIKNHMDINLRMLIKGVKTTL